MTKNTLITDVSVWVSNSRLQGIEEDASSYDIRIGNDTMSEVNNEKMVDKNVLCGSFVNGRIHLIYDYLTFRFI